MQECKVCSGQLKQGDIIKSIYLFGYQPIQCPHCGAEYAINLSSRLMVSFLTITPLSSLFLKSDFLAKFSTLSMVFVYGLWLIIVIYFTPKFVRYHKKHPDKKKAKTT